MAVWKVISHHEEPDDAFEAFRARGVIAVGWSQVGDLAVRQPTEDRTIAAWIRDVRPELNNSHTGGPSLWNFFGRMQVGDLVLVSARGRRQGVFEVTGPYIYVDESESVRGYRHLRSARLTDVDPNRLWYACGRRAAPDHAVRWTVALLPDPSLPLDQLRGEGATTGRPGKLPPEQYQAACHLAAQVQFHGADRREAVDTLVSVHGIAVGSAEALINNYRCLVAGTSIKAPMSADAMAHFVDDIVARKGAGALPNATSALASFIEYASSQWNHPATQMVELLERMRMDQSRDEELQPLHDAVAQIAAQVKSSVDLGPSEVLRAVWVRGPQHAAFRRLLDRRWAGKCSVHGVECNGQLRASHIVAWRLDEALRGDVDNGLLLSVPLDNLFDRGFISFSDDGLMIVSKKLHAKTAELFGILPGLRLNWDRLRTTERERLCANLKRHRDLHQEAGDLLM